MEELKLLVEVVVLVFLVEDLLAVLLIVLLMVDPVVVAEEVDTMVEVVELRVICISPDLVVVDLLTLAVL